MASGFSGYARDATPFVTAALLLLLAGALLWGVAVVWTALVTHRPPRMTPGRALARLGRAFPPDVGLDRYTEVTFEGVGPHPPGTAVRLVGWWIPHPGDTAVTRTCVMLHGYGDGCPGLLAWAPLWQRMGFHLLLLDLRAHGGSGGTCSSGGAWETADLHAVLDQLRQRHPTAARQLVLLGVSYGAMIATACAAERDDLLALLLESPIDGWASATRRYAELLGLPLAHAHPLRLRLAEWWLGVSFEEMRPVRRVGQVRCPILGILPQSDVLVSPEEAEHLANAVEAAGAGNVVWRPATGHNQALAVDATTYEHTLRRFLAGADIGPGE